MLALFGTLAGNIEIATVHSVKGATDKLGDEEDDLTNSLPDIVGNFFRYTLAFFWLLAFSSATHDIAADGFYMLGLTKHEQAFFVGIRSTFYRFAMLTGQ